MTLAARIPSYPWDDLAPLKEKANAFPGGAVDLSLGSPADPVPRVIQEALAAAADAPGYPTTAGTPALREAAVGWLARTLDVHVPSSAVLPVVGTKEFIAWLPTQLGLGPGDAVIYPELAYPTYEVGARLAGAMPVAADALDDSSGGSARLRWVNSPSNPTGLVLPADTLRETVAWARDRGCLLASDECYISLGWEVTPVSTLHTSVRGDSLTGVLSVFSLSKRSNLAGYRAGFVVGDPDLIASLLLIRKQSGMIVPKPVQAAMTAALRDDEHASEQKERYRARREVLREGLEAAGFTIEHSEAGLYLWASRPGLDGRAACELLAAECGILTGPGYMYGPSGASHIRMALTASDERVAAAGQRLRALGGRAALGRSGRLTGDGPVILDPVHDLVYPVAVGEPVPHPSWLPRPPASISPQPVLAIGRRTGSIHSHVGATTVDGNRGGADRPGARRRARPIRGQAWRQPVQRRGRPGTA